LAGIEYHAIGDEPAESGDSISMRYVVGRRSGTS
jgi:hypothetical protein